MNQKFLAGTSSSVVRQRTYMPCIPKLNSYRDLITVKRTNVEHLLVGKSAAISVLTVAFLKIYARATGGRSSTGGRAAG